MKIGGVTPLSLVDYPGRPAIVIFTGGCNLRCPFCHNGELVLGSEATDEGAVFDLLRSRLSKVGAVCITGGEPTIHDDLVEFVERIRALGFRVKLDTNGSRPRMLERLLARGLLDYVAIDVKSSPRGYGEATGGKLSFAVVVEAIAEVRKAKVPYELRTTAVPGIVELEDIAIVAKELGPVDHYALQQFRPSKTLDPSFGVRGVHSTTWFEQARVLLQAEAEEVTLRGV